MNSVFKYIFFLFMSFSLAQENDEILQLNNFQKGEEKLKIKDLKVAYNYYNSAYSYNTTNDVGKTSLIKSDSIRDILRKDLFEKIIGSWKLIDFEEKQNFDCIKITEDEIVFEFENNIIDTKKILFKENSRYYRYFFDLLLDENKIWRVYFEENRLKLWNSGGKRDDGVDFNYSCGGEVLVFERKK